MRVHVAPLPGGLPQTTCIAKLRAELLKPALTAPLLVAYLEFRGLHSVVDPSFQLEPAPVPAQVAIVVSKQI